jgi:uncharacterized glyoxalase superfamily protein PhnB
MKISDACLFVSNISHSVNFYQRMLNMNIEYQDGDFVVFSGLGISFAIWSHEAAKKELLRHFRSDPKQEEIQFKNSSEKDTRLNQVMLSVHLENKQAVDMEYERLSNQRIIFLTPPKSFPWNDYATYFLDPDNYLWSIYCKI